MNFPISNGSPLKGRDSKSLRFDCDARSRCELTVGTVGLRARAVSWCLHRYPLINGCGTVANLPFVRSLMGELPELVRAPLSSGHVAVVPTDDYVGRAMYSVGDLDRKVSRTIDRFVEEGEWVLDVGANLGLCTLQLAGAVGPSGQVDAFEPNPTMVRLLSGSISLNMLPNVRLHSCALGASEGTAELSVPSDHAGKGSLIAGGRDEELRRVSVSVRSLDSIIEQGQRRIGFVKMDVEGCEEQVLLGASRLLRESPPEAWIFEMHQMPSEPGTSALLSGFMDAGYELFAITGRLLRVSYVPVPRHGVFVRPPGHDVLAVHRDSRKLEDPGLRRRG